MSSSGSLSRWFLPVLVVSMTSSMWSANQLHALLPQHVRRVAPAPRGRVGAVGANVHAAPMRTAESSDREQSVWQGDQET